MQVVKRLGLFLATALFALSLFAPAHPAVAQGAALSVTPGSAPQNSVVVFSFSGFQDSEPVSLWLTLPNYAVVPLGDVIVTSAGGGELPVFISTAFPTGVHYFSARGNKSGLLATTRFELTLGQGAGNSAGVTVTAGSASISQGECIDFAGTGFAANETIAVWLRFPDNTVFDFGEIKADSAGRIADGLCSGRLDSEGTYYYTAYGKSSGLTGIASFNLARGDYIGAPAGGATLRVEPSTAKQLDIVTLVGGGFQAGEVISLWITLPDGAVLTMFEGVTVDGTFAQDIFLPPLPVGRHYFSAYGQSSGLRAIAAFDLQPGTGEDD